MSTSPGSRGPAPSPAPRPPVVTADADGGPDEEIFAVLARDREHREASSALTAVDEVLAVLAQPSGRAEAGAVTEAVSAAVDDVELASVVLELRSQEALHRIALDTTSRLLPSSLLTLIR